MTVASPPQVVVAGTVCLDIIPVLPHAAELRPGSTVEAGPAVLSTGGAVANVGLALFRLGVPVRMMGKIGDDLFGRAVLDILVRHDPRLAASMILSPGEQTSYSVVLNPPDVDRSFIHSPGANDTFVAADVSLELVDGARVFHFGYPPVLRRFYRDGGAELHALLASVRDRGVVTCLDVCRPDSRSDAGRVDWHAIFARALPAVDVFAPSFDEVCLMLAEEGGGPSLGRLRVLATKLLGMGPAVVALKLGDQGLYVRTSGDAGSIERVCTRLALDAAAWRDREVLSPCFRARRVVGTIGSGDSTIAGLLAAILRGVDPVAAATAAVAVGACSVEAADATSGIPPWAAVVERLAAGWPRLPVDAEIIGDAGWQRDEHGTLFDPVPA